MRRICAIAAMDEGRGIGFRGQIPWNISDDMKRFKTLTTGHAVLMGRKTFLSLPERFRPLPDRLNIVISGNPDFPKQHADVLAFVTPELAIRSFRDLSLKTPTDTLWIIGGEQTYRATVPFWDEVFLTKVFGHFESDAFFPSFEDEFAAVEESLMDNYSFHHYKRI